MRYPSLGSKRSRSSDDDESQTSFITVEDEQVGLSQKDLKSAMEMTGFDPNSPCQASKNLPKKMKTKIATYLALGQDIAEGVKNKNSTKKPKPSNVEEEEVETEDNGDDLC